MYAKKLFLLPVLMIGASVSFGMDSFAEDKTTDAIVEYQSGDITFDPDPGNPAAALPTNLNFGTHEIQSKVDETWIATADGNQASAPTSGGVSVSDNRGASGASSGWSVKLAQANQFAAGTSQLTGAQLSIEVGALTNNLGSVPSGPNKVNETVDIAIGTTYDILTANADEGAGETSLALDKFSLMVPKNIEKKAAEYQTALTWTFSATP